MDLLSDRVFLYLNAIGLQKEAKKFLKKGRRNDKISFSAITLEKQDPAEISQKLNLPLSGFECINDPESPQIVTTSTENDEKSKNISIKEKIQDSTHGIPFKRVREEEVEFLRDELKNNDFSAKKGAKGSYGEKAYIDLKDTRGKDFRQEKNKKKKGAYRGGKIDTGVHSIKFDSDSE